MATRSRINSIKTWLEVATCGLAHDSADRVRQEIQGHYEAARAEADLTGAGALEALGSASAANKEFRRVYITADERRLMIEDAYVSRMICSRRYLAAIPVVLLCAAIVAFTVKPGSLTGGLLMVAGGIALVVTVPMLVPINTIARGRVYRGIRSAWLAAVLTFACWPLTTRQDWALFVATGASSGWIMIWIEWTRASMRRKIPISQWPRSLYL